MCPYPLCDNTHEDAGSFQYHLMDVHRFSRSRPRKGTNPIRQLSPDQKILPDAGADGARPCRQRKSANSSKALEWTPPQSLDATATTPEERRSCRPLKRKRQSPPTPTICPEVITIDDDMSDDHTAQSAVASLTLSAPSPLSIEDDDNCTNLKCGPFPSYCTIPNEPIYSLEPDHFDDGSDLDTLFDQFLRSSSPSLSPDDATSELSGATMIDTKRGQSRDSAESYTETLKSPFPEDVSERESSRPRGHLPYYILPSHSSAS